MGPTHVLAIDQGTTGTTSLVFDAQGAIAGRGYAEISQHYPQPGWVEHEPIEIWESVLATTEMALESAGIGPTHLAGIGITNQRETAVLWDRATGKPVHRAIVWQCRRSAGICEELKASGKEALFRDRTGLVLDAYFSGTKLTWLFRQHPELAARAAGGELAFGTVDSWLIWNLTGGQVHATDATNASRTLLFDINERRWDPELAEVLEVPLGILPEVRGSAEIVGSAANFHGADVPIAGIAGDQQAALFGQGCVEAGSAKNTYGTGCFLMLNTGEVRRSSSHGLLETLAVGPDLQPCFALEGSVFIAGALIQWLRDELQIIGSAAESESVAEGCASSDGVHVVPAFVGLGAPYWDMEARGAIAGLTRGSGVPQIVRAALEAIAFQSRDVLEAMEKDAGLRLSNLRVDGGATANSLLMQFQADLLGISVDRPEIAETTAAGAAYLAGLATGFYADLDTVASVRRSERVFEPQQERGFGDELQAGWRRAVARVRLRPTE